MIGIQIKDNLIFYYGNLVGYVNGTKAVADTMFQTDELEAYLIKEKYAVSFNDGIYDRLISGEFAINGEKRLRIWQLKSNSDMGLRFISYQDLQERYGALNINNYEVVYDGKTDTQNLEVIYDEFNINLETDFEGHPLSISDIIELYDDCENRYWYVDRIGFHEIKI